MADLWADWMHRDREGTRVKTSLARQARRIARGWKLEESLVGPELHKALKVAQQASLASDFSGLTSCGDILGKPARDYNWLREGRLEMRTESIALTAQERRTWVKALRFKANNVADAKCRLCHSEEDHAKETVGHILTACPKTRMGSIKERHDSVCAALYRAMCREFELTPRYEYDVPAPLVENDNGRICWDFRHPVDNVRNDRPDITVTNKRTGTMFLVEVAVCMPDRMNDSYAEKVERYQVLRDRLTRGLKIPVEVIVVVLSVFGNVHVKARDALLGLGVPRKNVDNVIALAQRLVVLGTVSTIKRHLAVKA